MTIQVPNCRPITWAEFQNTLHQTPMDDRYRLHPNLEQLIRRLKAEGARVPSEALTLHTTLQAEAMEAMFDNVPV